MWKRFSKEPKPPETTPGLLEDRVRALESRVRQLDDDLADLFDRLQRLQGRRAKREQREEAHQASQPEDGLDPISRAIILERQGMNGAHR